LSGKDSKFMVVTLILLAIIIILSIILLIKRVYGGE